MLPEELSKLIGKVVDVSIMEVEKGAIKRFADAVGDENPLYWDDEYAGNSRHGSIIAPPGFFGWPKNPGTISSPIPTEVTLALAKAGYDMAALINVGTEFELFSPIRAGDRLVSSSMIKNISERKGRSGKMVFIIMETTYTNQNGDVVAKARGTVIQR